VRHHIAGLQRGNARHRLKHVATRLPPARYHTDIQCRNRRRHNNCLNHQRPPRRHCQRPQLVKGKSPQGSRVTEQIEQFLLCSAAQLTSFSSPSVTTSRFTSSMLPHVSLDESQLLKPSSTTPRSYGRRHLSWHYEPQEHINC
jgi:hypothetical protein